ncbi:hypothetical protein ACWEQC_28940 [Streptomyces shenzhenensis]
MGERIHGRAAAVGRSAEELLHDAILRALARDRSIRQAQLACAAGCGAPPPHDERPVGCAVDAEVLARTSPARNSVVNYYGFITVDYEHELAQLDENGHRLPTVPQSGWNSRDAPSHRFKPD